MLGQELIVAATDGRPPALIEGSGRRRPPDRAGQEALSHPVKQKRSVMPHFRPTISLKGWEASHLMCAYPAV